MKTQSGVGSSDRETVSKFRFDGILDGSSQDEVYETVARDVVSHVITGHNGTIFCYGQTGAGKTYTMTGNPGLFEHRGITPRAISQLFQEIQARTAHSYTVRASYLEIYNDNIVDLLAATQPESLSIVTEDGVTSVKGLSMEAVTSEEEALATFFRGEQARTNARHGQNESSSRSHCVFTVTLEATDVGGRQTQPLLSKINLVDLAGSERAKKANATGDQMMEAQYINKSLSFLEQVVQALVKRSAHVPFRQSKLTAVLRDALGGNSRAAMIANIWPEKDNVEEISVRLVGGVNVGHDLCECHRRSKALT